VLLPFGARHEAIGARCDAFIGFEPSVQRRWHRFGLSGAGLVWDGEAFAVVPAGRANPNQLHLGPNSAGDLETLRTEVLAGAAAASEDCPTAAARPLIGLQFEHPRDVMLSRRIDRNRICRTFSDCTTAPRLGLPSGCYPLDEACKHSLEMLRLQSLKRG